jgi:hypothetical protein
MPREDRMRFGLPGTLLDDEITALWDAPVHAAALRWGL